MSKNAKDRRPYIKPVQRIQLSEKNIRLRMILIVVFLSIAVVAIITGLLSVLNTEPGWQTVEVSTSNINCSQDFVFQYDCGQGALSATEEYRALTMLYTDLTENGYRIFSAEAGGTGNLWELNNRPNEVVTVDPVLYDALEKLVRYDSRYPFLAPAVSQYGAVFLSAGDGEAALYDPTKNEEKAVYVREAAAYAADEGMIRLELLGGNQARLFVAGEYLDHAAENRIDVFMDFGWMKNAFIIDFIADALIENGFTNGYLASFDGYTRNLDTRGQGYSYNLFDRWGDTISIPASLNYHRPISIATLRSYPLSEEDRWRYYVYEDGTVSHVLLDIADGMCRSSTDNLTAYSYEGGCAELALELAPMFIARELDLDVLEALEEQGIHTIWAEENVLYHTEAAASIELLEDSGGADYRIS